MSDHMARLRNVMRLPFCEYNLVAPVSLEGGILSVMAVDPKAPAVESALGLLRRQYDVRVNSATETSVRAQIDRVFRERCGGCGAVVNAGAGLCPTCQARQMAAAARPVGGPAYSYAAPPPPPPPPAPPPVTSVPASGSVVGQTCPYCQTPIKPGVGVHVCTHCSMPHHAECWSDNGGCTTFGCAGAKAASSAHTAGHMPPPPPPQPGYYPGPPVGYVPVGYNPRLANINTHMAESIFTTLLCCLPVGVAAIYFSSQAEAHKKVGDHLAALAAADRANMLNIVACIGWFVLIFLLFVI